MTERQRRFAEEYRQCGDGCAAAVRAGYSAARARRQAKALLRRPEIAALIAVGADVTIDAAREAGVGGTAGGAETAGVAETAGGGGDARAGAAEAESGGAGGMPDGVSQKRIVRELARIAFEESEVRDGDKLRALEMLTKLLPPDAGDDGAAGGVVILPEVMAAETRE